MKLSKRKIELMLVDIAIIICVYYMTALVGILRLHSIVLNGELNLTRDYADDRANPLRCVPKCLALRQYRDLSDHYGFGFYIQFDSDAHRSGVVCGEFGHWCAHDRGHGYFTGDTAVQVLLSAPLRLPLQKRR